MKESQSKISFIRTIKDRPIIDLNKYQFLFEGYILERNPNHIDSKIISEIYLYNNIDSKGQYNPTQEIESILSIISKQKNKIEEDKEKISLTLNRIIEKYSYIGLDKESYFSDKVFFLLKQVVPIILDKSVYSSNLNKDIKASLLILFLLHREILFKENCEYLNRKYIQGQINLDKNYFSRIKKEFFYYLDTYDIIHEIEEGKYYYKNEIKNKHFLIKLLSSLDKELLKLFFEKLDRYKLKFSISLFIEDTRIKFDCNLLIKYVVSRRSIDNKELTLLKDQFNNLYQSVVVEDGFDTTFSRFIRSILANLFVLERGFLDNHNRFVNFLSFVDNQDITKDFINSYIFTDKSIKGISLNQERDIVVNFSYQEFIKKNPTPNNITNFFYSQLRLLIDFNFKSIVFSFSLPEEGDEDISLLLELKKDFYDKFLLVKEEYKKDFGIETKTEAKFLS